MRGIPGQSAAGRPESFWRYREVQALVGELRESGRKLIDAATLQKLLSTRGSGPYWTALREGKENYDIETSRQDNILASLRKYKGQHTLVVVSHRISAVQEADLILVLDEGVVAQRGTHRDLSRSEGLYRDLWRKQQLEEEIRAL